MWDFETAEVSTATVAAGAATDTGGTATVNLVASPDAADTVVFTITTTAEDGTVTTTTQEVPPARPYPWTCRCPSVRRRSRSRRKVW